MENDNNQSQQISDDELWARAGNRQSISRDDMGITTPIQSDGLQSLNEGFNVLTFEKHGQKNNQE